MRCISRTLLLFFPLLAFAGKDPSDHPLRVQLIQITSSPQGPIRGVYQGTGRGNIVEGDSIHGFDFSYLCEAQLTTTAAGQTYSAKWKKPQLRMELLGSKLGEKEKYVECDLRTSVNEGVYVMNGASIGEMSQENFKVWRSKRAQALHPLPAGSAVCKLSVNSTPGGAEIEIDGEFRGDTPSTLEIPPGEHAVTVRKAGYKAWQRKLKLAGAITLNADLETE
jgi:hypothetical protein